MNRTLRNVVAAAGTAVTIGVTATGCNTPNYSDMLSLSCPFGAVRVHQDFVRGGFSNMTVYAPAGTDINLADIVDNNYGNIREFKSNTQHTYGQPLNFFWDTWSHIDALTVSFNGHTAPGCTPRIKVEQPE